MKRILLLSLAIGVTIVAADQNKTNEDPSFSGDMETYRSKRQVQGPFVKPEEGMDSGSDSDSSEFDHRPHFIPPPQPLPGPVLVQRPPPIPVADMPLPPPQPIPFPLSAENGVVVDPFPLPQPMPQSGDFRRPFPSSTTPLPSTRPPPTTRPLPPPPSSLSCSSIRCPSGSVCRMQNNRLSRRDEPVCVFTGTNSPSSCSQVRCSAGFNCEMQQSSSCCRLPCPSTPVCVQIPIITPPPPLISCENVRCGAGTLCRIQTVDNCTFAPCAMQAVCISPCSSVNCPSNSECRVDERTMATSCVPKGPSHSNPSCNGVRCGFGERCTIVKNCVWSRECRDEAKCIRF